MLYGIDTSMWQGQINWQAVKRSGRHFGMVKASEGVNFQDPQFSNSWGELKRVGLHRIAYHYLRPYEDGDSQAEFMHHVLHSNGGTTNTDLICLDCETTDGLSAEAVVLCASNFIARIKQLTHRNCTFYTYTYFWDSVLGRPNNKEILSSPLHMASLAAVPPSRENWPVLTFWQYNAEGNVPGVNGAVDLDVFMGDEKQYHALATGK